MSTTSFPDARPLLDHDNKPVLIVVHADHVIDGVNRNNPKFFGSIFLNNIEVLSTATNPDGSVKVLPLDPSKGGTGFDNLNDLAKEIMKILGIGDGASVDNVVVPVSKGGTGSTTAAAARTALGAASAALYKKTISTSWSSNSGGGYYQDVTFSTMTASDIAIVGMNYSGSDSSGYSTAAHAMQLIQRADTMAGKIRLYAYTTKPSAAIAMQFLVIRGAANYTS